MLNDKQTLVLSGVMAGGIFVTGILDILTHYIVLTLLTIVFLAITINIFYVNRILKKRK